MNASRAPRSLTLLIVLTGGCGGGSSMMNSMPDAVVTAPVITAQPSDDSVPMGLGAAFSVSASGTNLQYRWAKNGAAISGAMGSTYTTAPLGFADSGAIFTVTVSNAGGAVTSQPAHLAVTARAPRPGDLRFGQVDAPSTVNGYGSFGVSTDLPGRYVSYYGGSFGTPFYVGAGNCAVPAVTNGMGCTWFYSEVPVAAGGLGAGYASDSYANFGADLQNATWPQFDGAAISPTAASAVITSLDLEAASDLFALAWTQSDQSSGFDLQLGTLPADQLQAAATEAGAAGRVLTALAEDGGQITYASYGWRADTASIYEAQVLTTSATQAPAAAASLAARGYLITASGRADASGNILLVGTRVQGDTMARPFAAAQGDAQAASLQARGYANVAVFVDLTQSNPYTYVYER